MLVSQINLKKDLKCIHKILASNRGIAIPLDLESQVAQMFNKASILTRQTSKWLHASKTPKIERSQSQVNYLCSTTLNIKPYHFS